MASNGISDRVAIVGMGCTRFGIHRDQGVDDLLVAAATEATESAGVELGDVDAFWLGTFGSSVAGTTLSRPLKLVHKPVSRNENFCATGSDAFRNACYAVASGAYDTAMAIGVEKMSDAGASGIPFTVPPTDGTTMEITPPGAFSYLATGYAQRYGLELDGVREAMTHVAWKNHRNGVANVRAQFRAEVARETIAAARPLAGCLSLYDCGGLGDGSAAAIVVRAEDAHRYTDRPVYVKALALAAGAATGHMDAGYDFGSLPEVGASATDAYRQAGVTDPRAQIALAEVHDCFTITEILLMEELGFADRGTSWRAVLDGRFDRDGALPVNPDGGLKSFGHPLGASGIRMLFECWLQLRGEAGDRQVPVDGRLALTQNTGGNPGEGLSFVSILGAEVA